MGRGAPRPPDGLTVAETPDVLVIDDVRTFSFPAVYARTVSEGLALIASRAWREVWLDHNLGRGADIMPIVRFLTEQAAGGQPVNVRLIYVHTSDPVAGDAMMAGLGPWYHVRRAVAHGFLAPS